MSLGVILGYFGLITIVRKFSFPCKFPCKYVVLPKSVPKDYGVE